jgi:Flp pilus assembly protein TadD
MPPWKPEPGSGPFIGERRLTPAQIDVFRRWADEGAKEGDPRELPPPPALPDGWQLGLPDLVVTLPAYQVSASGSDVFRIFVVPVPTSVRRFVAGLEFRPGKSSIVHHANIRLDPTPASRLLDEADPLPGYDGLLAHSAIYPDGHFLSWTPGQVAPLLPKGLAWRLDPGADLVVELHLQPTGKPETIQPSIGLFFTRDPPERIPGMLRLGRQDIDIAAGESHYEVTDSFVLPVPVDVLAVQPHAHDHARVVRAFATLPGGSTRPLVEIRDWDIRWQQVYRYETPVSLPSGTRIAMRYEYDNSPGNLRIAQPPARVTWGQRSADEMGDFWVQVLTRDDRDLQTLLAAFHPKAIAEDIVGYEARIRAEPTSVALHDDVALLYLDQGRADQAVAHFEQAVALVPDSARARFNLGTALAFAGETDKAVTSYRAALALRPDYALAHNNLGALLLQRGDLDEAAVHLEAAVGLDATNAEAQTNLGRLDRVRGNASAARDRFMLAASLRPEWADPLVEAAWVLLNGESDVRDPARAASLAEGAATLTGRRDAAALDVLAAALAARGDFSRAVATAQEALRLAPAPLRERIRARLDGYRAGRPAGLP